MKELVTIDSTVNSLLEVMPEHKEMLTTIQENLPEIARGTSLFGKTQSQFMDNMLTVSHPTPLRNMRQILAEIEKTSGALKEVYFKNEKKKIEIKIKQRELENEEDDLKQEFIQVEIDELRNQLATTETYISGAIRKITNYTIQYKSIEKKIMEEQGVDQFNEIDFEKEESRYHVMKAFDQALCAARANNGRIDEGNHIYFRQIGVNGATAQRYIDLFLKDELELLKENKAPSHDAVLVFLNQMADKFESNPTEYAERKGMQIQTEKALLTKGNTSLMLDNKKNC
jgi:small-conductance mechanosensitive channel